MFFYVRSENVILSSPSKENGNAIASFSCIMINAYIFVSVHSIAMCILTT